MFTPRLRDSTAARVRSESTRVRGTTRTSQRVRFEVGHNLQRLFAAPHVVNQPPLEERHVPSVADDDVIEHVDPDQLANRAETRGDLVVLRATGKACPIWSSASVAEGDSR